MEKREIHKFILPLEVFAIIPFDYGILQFTNSVCIAVNFENSVDHCSLFAVVGISQYSIGAWLSQNRGKPLYRIYVDHPLHIEQIYCDFYGVALANLIYPLDVRSTY